MPVFHQMVGFAFGTYIYQLHISILPRGLRYKWTNTEIIPKAIAIFDWQKTFRGETVHKKCNLLVPFYNFFIILSLKNMIINLLNGWTKFFLQKQPSRGVPFLEKSVLKIRSKFTGEQPYRSVISIKLQISVWVFSSKFAGYFQNTFS